MAEKLTTKMQEVMDAIDAGGGWAHMPRPMFKTLSAMHRRGLVEYFREEGYTGEGRSQRLVISYAVRRTAAAARLAE